MGVSLTSIAQGAMAAAVSLGSSVQSAGANALQLAASVPQALPSSVQAGAATSAHLATGLTAVEKPAKVMANAIPKSSALVRAAGFLSKALPVVTIGAGALAGAKIVDEQGVAALVKTKGGRSAVLSTVGGVLLLVPNPATQLAAAGVLAGVAVNQFGGLDRLDGPTQAVQALRPTHTS